ncbi:MAG: type site-specific deoxyribonuclease, HsdR family [Deltaproteobacteria bacterium]|nr:type site-specific deoxyribonuclease, HsdR family [Deltaproteobacteria bacterium]
MLPGVTDLLKPLMSEYLHVEKPFLDQLAALGWTVVDQGYGFIPSDPAVSLRGRFREWMLPEVFRDAVRSLNLTADGKEWLTERQLDDLRDQIVFDFTLGTHPISTKGTTESGGANRRSALGLCLH